MSKINNQHHLYLLPRYLKATGDNAEKLQQICDDHQATFAVARGSLYKHQAWEGGYLQHVVDTMQIAQNIYRYTPWEMPFTWSSVVLVLFLHDIEKPFMQLQFAIGAPEDYRPWPEEKRWCFREEIIVKYKINIMPVEILALKYIHGEGTDYHPTQRKMNELGALCHAADVLSARLWHSRNKPE